MSQSLNILFISSEAVPFVKTGGLGDVAGVLPKILRKMGHNVRLVLPRYYSIDINKKNIHHLPGPLGVPMGILGELWAGVYESTLPDSDVPVYFIDYEQYFGRAGIYTDEHGEGFKDNDNRFVFFSRAALQLTKRLFFTPDIVHVHDWHTAAVPVMLNTFYQHDLHLASAASVLTIHNMQHQGNFYPGLMDVLSVGWHHYHPLGLEHYGQVNLMKGGIYHANAINTVSKGYAAEIMTAEYGYGLDGVMRDRCKSFFGIVNGIDMQEWNPEKDPYLSEGFSAKDLSGKEKLKAELQKKMGLPVKPDIPVIGIISRLVEQKGIDVIAEAMPGILSMEVQIVLLGSGAPWAHFYFGGLAAHHRDKMSVVIGYNEPLAHLIEAGSDFFLMPSRFEPCGLNQMYSQRYGTLPIVRATGGLNDTVDNLNEETGHGTGFKLYYLSAKSLFDTVGWALHIYYNRKDILRNMIREAMSRDFSWERSARKYEQLYRIALKKKRGRHYRISALPEKGKKSRKKKT